MRREQPLSGHRLPGSDPRPFIRRVSRLRMNAAPLYAKPCPSARPRKLTPKRTQAEAPAIGGRLVTGFSLERRFGWASPAERLQQTAKPWARPSSCLPSASSSRDCFSFGLSPLLPPMAWMIQLCSLLETPGWQELSNPSHPCRPYRRPAWPERQNPSSVFRQPSLQLSPGGQRRNSHPVRRPSRPWQGR
jgi:hypothetical protein